MSPSESVIARWMGSVDAKLEQLAKDVTDERSGSAQYRRDMRERMEGQDHSLADLDRDIKEMKAIKPVVDQLRDERLKQRGMILTLTALGAFAAWLLANFGSDILQRLHP